MVMITDPVADLLIRIKNGYMASKIEVTMPYTRLKESIARVLYEHEFVDDVTVNEQENKKWLTVYLKYDDKKQPALIDIKQVSTPGRRVYKPYAKLRSIRGGFGITVISTSKGVMSSEKARKQKLGGEVLAEVW